MIQVKFDKSEDGKTLVLTVNGHANKAEAGRDIVCSAASILACTVAQCVTFMYEEHKLRKKPNIRLEDGDAVITCKPHKSFYAEAMHTYSVAQVGFALLAQTYPECVSIKLFGREFNP